MHFLVLTVVEEKTGRSRPWMRDLILPHAIERAVLEARRFHLTNSFLQGLPLNHGRDHVCRIRTCIEPAMTCNREKCLCTAAL